jgi:hypothetical protein
MRLEWIQMKWNSWGISHIARHNVSPEEVEECIFENALFVLKPKKKYRDRYALPVPER